MAKKLKVGVVGVGYFGRHHARVYSELDGVELVGVADANPARARDVAEKHRVAAFADHRELFGKVDAVSVAVPTRDHARVSCDLLEKGISVLVEKPMAATVAEAKAIRASAVKSGAVIQVGHITRFTPVLQAVREMNIVPRLIEVNRLSPFSFRSLDVGVVLDMMIHDIDLVLQLAGGRVKSIDAVGFALVGKTEDICNARITFDDGCVATLTASRVALKKTRRMRVYSSDGYIALDFDTNYALLIRKSKEFSPGAADMEALKELPTEELRRLMLEKFLNVREMTLVGQEPLKAQLQSFVDCVRNRTQPVVSAEDGIRTMETAERILEAVRAGR